MTILNVITRKGTVMLPACGMLAQQEDALVCRWGGEEFVIWFSDSGKMCDPNELCHSMQKMPIPIRSIDREVHVTISIGVAVGDENMTELIERADVLLYKAKANGRNRVEQES